MSDGDGLYLLIRPKGTARSIWWWRFDYSVKGRRKTLSVGTYPDTGLAAARRRADEARQLVQEGIDPSDQRKAAKTEERRVRENERRVEAGLPLEGSFEAVAREWYVVWAPTKASSHATKVLGRLVADAFPWIGGRHVGDIKARDLLELFNRVKGRGALETAHRVVQHCGQVIRYAVAVKGIADRDPSFDLRGQLPWATVKHFAALIEPREVGALMRAIDGFSGTYTVKAALRLSPMLFVRPGELRKAKWAEFDLDAAEWKFFVTKTKTDHIVPLATQAVAILRDLYPLTSKGPYVFPGAHGWRIPMSDTAINAALRRMGYDTKAEITGHGFRAMARTILHEQLNIDRDVIEHQLAHRVPDVLGTAYNRTKFIKQRREMMQLWADYLDQIKTPADVVVIRAGTA